MIITADGSYKLRMNNRSNALTRTSVYVSGEFGTATAKIVYHDSTGLAVPLLGGDLATGEQYLVHDGGEVVLSILVETAEEGVTAIDIVSFGVV